jgi:hypothetical protein
MLRTLYFILVFCEIALNGWAIGKIILIPLIIVLKDNRIMGNFAIFQWKTGRLNLMFFISKTKNHVAFCNDKTYNPC